MSYASARVTTSASRPSITDRACLPEPPCDWLMVTACPFFTFHWAANAALTAWYSSRVGSYDTLSSVTADCACNVVAVTSAERVRRSERREIICHPPGGLDRHDPSATSRSVAGHDGQPA